MIVISQPFGDNANHFLYSLTRIIYQAPVIVRDSKVHLLQLKGESFYLQHSWCKNFAVTQVRLQNWRALNTLK